MARTPSANEAWNTEKRIKDRKQGVALDLLGQKFGHLTVVEKSGHNKHGRVVWRCVCVCGASTTAESAVLRSGKKASCGCKQYGKGSAIYNWSGHGEMPGSYMCQIRNGAKSRGLGFEITGEYVWGLFVSQEGRCALSDWPISFNDKTASLDRKDGSLGYAVGNVWWVHKDINLMRNKFGVDYFVLACAAVAKKRVVVVHGTC